jgi:hypothetical protein
LSDDSNSITEGDSVQYCPSEPANPEQYHRGFDPPREVASFSVVTHADEPLAQVYKILILVTLNVGARLTVM